MRYVLVLLLACFAVASAALTTEYTKEEDAKCAREGGCHVLTLKAMRQLYGDGHKAGVIVGMLQCRT